MRLSGITLDSMVDGPGLRIVLFAQGCHHQCPYCQNPETWDCNSGEEYSVKQVIRKIKKNCKNKRGITFSGGEPFLQAEELAEIAYTAHQMNLDIVTYTGFTYEQLLINTDSSIQDLLKKSDILIDGKYMHELRNIGLRFRGSSNQRVIDIAASAINERVMLWCA
ncbi:MAG: anaerobic ribonucleoside-triphosphate reductase activating protein [Treponema sp.]|nr:anaerobic ribonucleoside-triphosphate reductase activating protein [Treponema sp.]